MSIQYIMDLNAVKNSTSTLAATRLLAIKAIELQYMSLREILENLSDYDINHLLTLAMHPPYKDDGRMDPFYAEFATFTMVSSTAEGSMLLTEETYLTILKQMAAILSLEGMKRKGYVDFFVDKVNLGVVDSTVIAVTIKEKEASLKLAAAVFGVETPEEFRFDQMFGPDNTDSDENESE